MVAARAALSAFAGHQRELRRETTGEQEDSSRGAVGPQNALGTPRTIPGLFPGLCAAIRGFSPSFERFLFTASATEPIENHRQFNRFTRRRATYGMGAFNL